MSPKRASFPSHNKTAKFLVTQQVESNGTDGGRAARPMSDKAIAGPFYLRLLGIDHTQEANRVIAPM